MNGPRVAPPPRRCLSLLFLLILATSAFATEVPVAPLRYGPMSYPSYGATDALRGGNTHLVLMASYQGPHVNTMRRARLFALDGTPLQPESMSIGAGEIVSAAWTGNAYELVISAGQTPMPNSSPRTFSRVFVSEEGVVQFRRVDDGVWRPSVSLPTAAGTLLAGTNAQQNVIALAASSGTIVWRKDVDFRVLAFARSGDAFLALALQGIAVHLIPIALDGAIGSSRAIAIETNELISRAAVAVTAEGIYAAWQTNRDVATAIVSGTDARVEITRSAILAGIITAGGEAQLVWSRGASRWCTTPMQSGRESCIATTTNVYVSGTEQPLFAGSAGGASRAATTLEQLPAGRHLHEVVYPQTAPAISRTDSGWLVAWVEHEPTDYRQVHVARFLADGTRIDERLASPALMTQQSPRFARAGDRILLVWTDAKNDSYVRGLLFDANGERVGAAFDVARGFAPSVASNGREFAVVWETNSSSTPPHPLRAAVVTTDGRVVSPSLIAEDRGYSAQPSIGADAEGYVIAYLGRNGTEERVVAQHVDALLTRTNLPRTLVSRESVLFPDFASPRVICNTSCVVAWRRDEQDPNRQYVDVAPAGGGAVRTLATGTWIHAGTGGFMAGAELFDLDAAGGVVRIAKLTPIPFDFDLAGGAVYQRGNRVFLRLGPLVRRRASSP